MGGLGRAPSAPLLRERAAAIEAERELTADVLDALHERELFRLTLPAHVGGYELPIRCSLR